MLQKKILGPLGLAVAKHGFPSKVAPRTNNFEMATSCGYLGIFVNPIRHGNEMQFSLSCGISIKHVQAELIKTELYAQDYVGSTWTCGALVENLEKYKRWILPLSPASKALLSLGIRPRKGVFKGYVDAYMPVTADDATVERHVHRLMAQIDTYCWPFLSQYGFSEESFLSLCERDDDFVDVCFSSLEMQILAGLILARKLERDDAARVIKLIGEHKGAYYAKHGNPRPLELINKIGRQLDLL